MPLIRCSQRVSRLSQSTIYASMSTRPRDVIRSSRSTASAPDLPGEQGPARRAAGRVRAERRELLRWQAALNPFDVKVHLLHFVVAHRLARGDAFLAAVVLDGALERMQLAAPDVLFSAGDQFGNILGYGRVERRELDHALFDPAPGIARLPRTG